MSRNDHRSNSNSNKLQMKESFRTPANYGFDFRDFAGTTDCTTLYAIETDDNPRDCSAPPKFYGAYWATTPDPVNKLAVALWPEFGAPEFRDEEDNVDGKATQPGECFVSSASLGDGTKSLTMSVRPIRTVAEFRNFRTDLVKQILASRGLPTTGDKTEMIKRAQAAKILGD